MHQHYTMGTPKALIFWGYDPYLEGLKTFIFHGFWGPKVYHIQNQLTSHTHKFRTSNGGACGMGKGHCFKASLICCHSLRRGSDIIFLFDATKVGKINRDSTFT